MMVPPRDDNYLVLLVRSSDDIPTLAGRLESF